VATDRSAYEGALGAADAVERAVEVDGTKGE
jgi:hypothetical protein